jgi:hypothetical protein
MDFHCQGLDLENLQENLSEGPPLVREEIIDQGTLDVIQAAEYGEPPINITNFHVQCKSGTIQRLLEFGLSTWDSRCPSADLDDSLRQPEILDLVSVEKDCSYRNMATDSAEFLAIH